MKKKLIIASAFFLFSHTGFSQGLFSKAIAKLAKVMAPPAPAVSSLADVTPMVGIGSNLHSTDLGTMSQAMFPGWKTGGDLVYVMFNRKSSPGFVKLDGAVTINGIPAEYVTAGMYAAITDRSNAPRTISLTTSSGQSSSFTIEPNKSTLKIVSVNGQKDNINLDLTKDVTIEMEGLAANEKMLKVSLAINQVSIKSIYDVCFIRSGSRITIPAAAFRNINIKPANGAVYSYKKSYLSIGVEETTTAKNVTGVYPEVVYTNMYTDGKFVNVTNEPDLNLGLTAKGSDKLKDGEMSYDLYKPNAFTSRPAASLKKIGLLSCAIKGKTVSETSVITQEKDNLKGESQTTKTTTITFPKQTNETWDAVLAKIYPQLTAVLQSEMNATVVPADAVTKTATYKRIERLATEDVNTTNEFSKAYTNTKAFGPAVPFSEGTGNNSVTEKLINEAGVDGLMTINIELIPAQDGDFAVMVPKLTIEVAGKANGREAATTYYTATVTGKGIPSDHIGLKVAFTSANGLESKGRNDSKVYHTESPVSADELDKIIRRTDLVATFSKGLKELKEKEKANTDYETVWNLQQ